MLEASLGWRNAPLLWSLTLSAAILVGSSAIAQTKLYDDFHSANISPSKWQGDDSGGVSYLLNANREIIAGNGLHLLTRTYAATKNDGGGVGGLYGLKFPSPAAITAVSFTVDVANAAAVACLGTYAVTSAEFRGSFFNDQANTKSVMGDVSADVGPQRDSNDAQNGPLKVVGFVYECADVGCTQNVLDYQTLGTVAPSSTNTVGVVWDQPNHQFIFSLNGNQTFEHYSVADTSPPFYAHKGIHTARVVPDCKGTPRPYDEMDAYFGNVYVNQ